MRRSEIIAITLAATVSLAGCSLASANSQRDAALLFRALRANEQKYQLALHAEQEVVRRAEQMLNVKQGLPKESAEHLAQQVSSVELRFRDLRTKLDALPVNAGLREELLAPILDQLSREAGDLADVRQVLATGEAGVDRMAEAKSLLEAHSHPRNLFTPAIHRIREVYGVAKQRLWRGRPLTA